MMVRNQTERIRRLHGAALVSRVSVRSAASAAKVWTAVGGEKLSETNW